MSEVSHLRRDAFVLVTFALPDEGRNFASALKNSARLTTRSSPSVSPTLLGSLEGQATAVFYTGVGDNWLGRTGLKDFLVTRDVCGVISAGFVGGLMPRLRVGDLVLGENFSDSALVATARQILKDEPLHIGKIVLQNTVAETAAAKSALAAETGALAVDMETGWIAEICRQGKIPMLSLRVISDAAGQDFPVPGHILFDAARQRPRYLALPAWLLAHPGRIAPFVTFVRGLGPARERLARALRLLLAHW